MTQAIEIGRYRKLNVVELVPGGVLLGADGRKLFLPSHLTPKDVAIGDPIKVFIYADHDGAPQATTRVPAAILGEFAYLQCVSVTQVGAYLSWGVPKDLYVPPEEQQTPIVEGEGYVAVVCLDRKGEQLIASTRLTRHFDYDVEDVEPNDEVDLLVYGHIDAGVQVVVDQRYRGLIHRADVYSELANGAQLSGHIRQIREDNRLDVVLTRRGIEGIQDAQQVILAALKEAGGSLPLGERSSPGEIKRALGMSKKAFKRGVGSLYKARRVVIDDGRISLVDP
ncbi:MAG: GntR family transcriptional regulator [Deltaproteobacteria bacterium]|nr:MAG: GntR family transcriptional regulator [Deltaproteobacteria bacterium]